MSKLLIFFFVIFYSLSSQAKDILLLGNSMTIHYPKPTIGWYGKWGMAATNESADYGGRLASLLNETYPDESFNVTRVNLSQIERNNVFDLDSNTLKTLNRKYDLIIIFLGDNVSNNPASINFFSTNLYKLITLLTSDRPFVLVSTWWCKTDVDTFLLNFANSNHLEYVYLNGISKDPKLSANYSNPSLNIDVGKHPSNEGMDQIARKIIVHLGKNKWLKSY